MIRRIRKHALAESDLIDIWQYSFEEWDAVQADKYLDELDSGIRQLADNPEMGAKRDYVREGYRVLFINSHAVYYTATPSAIHIVRVLPDRIFLQELLQHPSEYFYGGLPFAIYSSCASLGAGVGFWSRP